MRRSRTPPASCSLRRLWATPSRRTPGLPPLPRLMPTGQPGGIRRTAFARQGIRPISPRRRRAGRPRGALLRIPHRTRPSCKEFPGPRGRLDEVALARAGRAAHAEVLRARDSLQRPQRLLGGAGTISRATEDREALESDARSSSAARRRGRWRWRQSGNRRRQCRCRRCGARVRESRRFARHPRRR